MYRELIQLVERFKRPRLAVVGDLMLDRYVFGDAERISPEAPIQILRASHEETRLGGAGSVVNNLLALGADVGVFGVLGKDLCGDQIMDGLAAAGARTTGVVRLKGRPTTIKTRFVGRAQHRHPQQLLRLDWEDSAALDRAAETKLLVRLRTFLRTADAVVISDYNKGVVTPHVAQQVIRLARARRLPVLIDPIKDHDYSKYRGATLITPNRMETELASGIRLKDMQDVHAAADKLLTGLKLQAVVVTLDKDGAYLAERGKKSGEWMITRPRLVYDVAGAGDMVISVLAMAVAAGADLPMAVRLANVAGGLEVQKFGVQTVSREEIIGELLDEAHKSGDKVRQLANLKMDLDRHRAAGEKIVWTNGCFDILHAGHVDFLQFAAAQGDILVVGLNTDASVRRNKGPERPICSEEHRARVLAALEAVDYIVLFDDPTPDRLIRTVRPDVLIKGEDWRHKGVVGREFVEAYGGRVVLAPLVKGLSTTALVDRIRRTAETKGGRT
jgi:D-beta-D-heptose 7-phosphate kinase / D-beta-D-heptose 1-phosphate adenosyltransferase